jgi:hypothetical protein
MRKRLILPLGLALAGLAAGCGMIDRMSGVSTARELQASGIAAKGEVLSIWETGIKVNGDPVIGLKVRVQPPEGAPYEATIPKSLIRFVDVPQFQPGKVVAIRIDPKQPARVALDVYTYH